MTNTKKKAWKYGSHRLLGEWEGWDRKVGRRPLWRLKADIWTDHLGNWRRVQTGNWLWTGSVQVRLGFTFFFWLYFKMVARVTRFYKRLPEQSTTDWKAGRLAGREGGKGPGQKLVTEMYQTATQLLNVFGRQSSENQETGPRTTQSAGSSTVYPPSSVTRKSLSLK